MNGIPKSFQDNLLNSYGFLTPVINDNTLHKKALILKTIK